MSVLQDSRKTDSVTWPDFGFMGSKEPWLFETRDFFENLKSGRKPVVGTDPRPRGSRKDEDFVGGSLDGAGDSLFAASSASRTVNGRGIK